MSFESVMGVSPDVMLELMFGMGMVGIIWMLLLSVALSIPPILVLISKRSQGYVAFLIFTKPVRDKATDDAPTPGGS
jgi:hypothetical protein